MNLWLIFAIAAPICWSLSNVIDAVIRRHYIKNDMVMTWYLAISRLPLVIGFFLIFGVEIPSVNTVIFMLLAGCAWMLPFVFYYKAMEFEEPSRVALLLQVVPIFTLVIAYLAIQERLSPQQFIAFFVLLCGGILAALKNKKEEGGWHFSKAFWIIGLASALWAISDVLFKHLQTDFSNFPSAFAIYLFGSFLPVFIIPFFIKNPKNPFTYFHGLPQKAWIMLSVNIIIGLIGSTLFAYALMLGTVSLTAAIMGIQPFFCFIFGLILSKFIIEIDKEDLSAKTLAIKISSFALIILGLYLL